MSASGGMRILKFKKAPEATPAEIDFNEKYEETKWMIDTMNSGVEQAKAVKKKRSRNQAALVVSNT